MSPAKTCRVPTVSLYICFFLVALAIAGNGIDLLIHKAWSVGAIFTAIGVAGLLGLIADLRSDHRYPWSK